MPSEEHYDDSAFTYFAISVLVIILIPSTFSYFKSKRNAILTQSHDISLEGSFFEQVHWNLWVSHMQVQSKTITGMDKCLEFVDFDSISDRLQLQKEARRPSGWGLLKFTAWLLVLVLLVFLVYRTSTFETTTSTVQQLYLIMFMCLQAPFDPYIVLELEVGATEEEIKKSYRRLSLKYHPGK
jgi:preprotein translocase subunit Sec63